MQLTPFKLERYFARYEFSAKYLLCSSDCESLSIGDLLAYEPGAEEEMKRHWLGYTESAGAPTLREEISRIYTGIQADQVLVHSGAEEAIFLFMQAVLKPGDHLIVHWPCYQSLFEIARSIGCEVTFWEARAENKWAPDLEELKRSLRPNTRAIIVNTPHNPTGYLMSPGDFLLLNSLAQEHGIILFSDEVYRGLEYDPGDRLPAACDINPSAVSLGVMSKTYGLAGLRIGWIATRNAAVLDQMAALKDYTTICSSAPSEYLAELALRHREEIAGRNLQIIHDNLALLDDFFAEQAEQFRMAAPKSRANRLPAPDRAGGGAVLPAPGDRIGGPAFTWHDVRSSGEPFQAGIRQKEHARGSAHDGTIPRPPRQREKPTMMTYCQYLREHPEDTYNKNYHDDEYGFPLTSDASLLERLVLEINQAGLSWITILKKKDHFHVAYDGFEVDKVAAYGDKDVDRLLADAGIIRNKLKVRAAIENARRIQTLRAEFGSFKGWLDKHHPLSLDEWTQLFKKTFVFTGGEIVKEFLVSSAYLPGAHDQECPVYQEIAKLHPAWSQGIEK